jgi:ubiquinone/menaquinone biosynthesis C-methylase UbiE
MRWNFVIKNILKYLPRKSKILVVSPSSQEVNFFLEKNYYDVTFGVYSKNDLKSLSLNNKFGNFLKIDARDIKFKDKYFDYTFVNAVLHHIDLPHLVVSELYRVSKKGVLIIEGNDSLIMRISTYFNFSEEYEKSATINEQGGLLGTSIPNYVYRWTEREIIKLLNSYNPEIFHKIQFSYDSYLKNEGVKKTHSVFKAIIRTILEPFLNIFLFIFRNQSNLISIYIDKEKSYKRIN